MFLEGEELMLEVASSGVEFASASVAFVALWPALRGQLWTRWSEIGAARARI